MDTKTRDKMFENFNKLYDQKKITIYFFKDSYSVEVEKNDIVNEEELQTFNKFLSEFIRALRRYVVENQSEDKYKEYIENFLEQNKNMRSEVLIKSTSNLNTLFNIENEILTKRNLNLKKDLFSVSVNVNFKRPAYRNENFEQINFELSLKDLNMIQEKIKNILSQIEKLDNEEV